MLFSTEMVSKYHPDKAADQISDAILTECLMQDKNSHVACETMFKGTTIVLGGEITTKGVVDYDEVARRVARKLGYEVTDVINLLSTQSPQINNAVMSVDSLGAGDQGIMFGYAVNGGKYYLARGQELAIDIIKAIEDDIEGNPDTILTGDAKTQVTMDDNNVDTILISVCHKEGLALEQVHAYVKSLLESKGLSDCRELLVNPSGLWTIGGPVADCGLTGRKIVCDQYGGFARVGGGAFSGKDPSKVDRSASYMARQIAVDIVKFFGTRVAKVQLAYAIGKTQPVSVWAETDGKDISSWVRKKYDLTPKGIINHLKLYELDYERMAEGCHMLWFCE